jgi:hypothetical protein
MTLTGFTSALWWGRTSSSQAIPFEDLDQALAELMRRERPAVVKALLDGFGDIPGLFVALWRSNKHSPAPRSPRQDEDGEQSGRDPDESLEDDLEDDFDDEDEEEDEADILNDVTDEKLAGYQWIDQGCEFIGPIRERSD